MRLLMFSVFDEKAAAFMEPFFFMNRGQAIRAFADAVNDQKHQFCRHPEDYTLFFVGEFDQASGMAHSLVAPQTLGTAVTFLNGSAVPQLVRKEVQV